MSSPARAAAAALRPAVRMAAAACAAAVVAALVATAGCGATGGGVDGQGASRGGADMATQGSGGGAEGGGEGDSASRGDSATASPGGSGAVSATRADGNLVIENGLDQPILIIQAGPRRLASELRGQRTEAGGFAFRGAVLVDNPGPQARAPRPDRFEHDGEAALVTAPLVAPGARLAVPGAGGAGARARYAVVPGGAPLLRLGDPAREAAPAPPDGSGLGGRIGWNEAAFLTLAAEPAVATAAAAEDGTAALAWPTAEGLALGQAPELPPVYRYGLWKDDLDALETHEVEAD